MSERTCRERFEQFWRGDAADRPSYLMYALFADTIKDDPAFRRLVEKGMAVGRWIAPYEEICPEVKWSTEKTTDGDSIIQRTRAATPVGKIMCEYRDGWICKYFLETAADYRVATWIAEHAAVVGCVDREIEHMKELPEWEVPMLLADKSPFQNILVSYAGLENFAFHLADMEDEVMSLYTALSRQFEKRMEFLARTPCTYIEILENFSADMVGAERYEKFILPVYEKCFSPLRASGRVIGVHCDGHTRACADLIASAPLDVVEALTEPPEGDMPVREARRIWPDKRLWCNIRVGNYGLPPRELAEHVRELWRDGSSDGGRVAFEMSEYLPDNWRESMPVVLDALGS